MTSSFSELDMSSGASSKSLRLTQDFFACGSRDADVEDVDEPVEASVSYNNSIKNTLVMLELKIDTRRTFYFFY